MWPTIVCQAHILLSKACTISWLVVSDIQTRYSDNEFEYRHVQLPKDMIKKIPKEYLDSSKGTLKLLWEEEWRGLGITQVHFDSLNFQMTQVLTQCIELRLGALRSA